MKDISERAFPKGHLEGMAFPKGERAKGMKGIVHKLEFSRGLFIKLNFCSDFEHNVWSNFKVEVQAKFEAGVWSVFCC